MPRGLPNMHQPMPETFSETLPTIAIVIASLGRPDILSEHLAELARQSQPPVRVVLSVTSEADLPSDWRAHGNVEIVIGSKGLCAQRNRGMEPVLGAADIIGFFDDDYIPSRFMVERMARFFALHPDVVAVNGDLVADGINGPGISVAEARAMLADYDAKAAPPQTVFREKWGLYGCNMAYRASAIGAERFDERLPLYGWQEDVDFSARVARGARAVKTKAFAGVHCGVKHGRSSGVKVGYSQVANPAYLAAKGSLGWPYARKIMWRNVAANHWKTLRPEPWVDRLGRVKGNWIALADMLTGRMRPERMLEL